MKDIIDFTEFRKDVLELLSPLERKYGVTILAGAISYSNYDFNLCVGVTKKTDIEQRAKFISNCRKYGFEPRDYASSIVVVGEKYKFVGFSDKNELSPCVLLRSDGAMFLVDEDFVNDNITRAYKSSNDGHKVTIDGFLEGI